MKFPKSQSLTNNIITIKQSVKDLACNIGKVYIDNIHNVNKDNRTVDSEKEERIYTIISNQGYLSNKETSINKLIK